MEEYFIGDRVKVIRDIYYKDLYPNNPGSRGNTVAITKGLIGKIVDVHKEGGELYSYICIDFVLSKVTGTWYLHKDDVEKVDIKGE